MQQSFWIAEFRRNEEGEDLYKFSKSCERERRIVEIFFESGGLLNLISVN